jgi:hypothetical protein
MKNKLTKLTCFAILLAAITAAPTICLAADSTNPPAAAHPAKPRPLPYHGKVVAVETNAMTFTIGQTTIAVGSTTRIFKGTKPAVFADITVGESVAGAYTKDDTGKATAGLVRIIPARPLPPTQTPAATPAPAPAPASAVAPAPAPAVK